MARSRLTTPEPWISRVRIDVPGVPLSIAREPSGSQCGGLGLQTAVHAFPPSVVTAERRLEERGNLVGLFCREDSVPLSSRFLRKKAGHTALGF